MYKIVRQVGDFDSDNPSKCQQLYSGLCNTATSPNFPELALEIQFCHSATVTRVTTVADMGNHAANM